MNKAYKIILFIDLIFSIPHCLFAQQKNDISGTIRDSKSGEALPYANIRVEGTYHSTVSNSDGYFNIVNEAVGKCSLIISFIGYITDTIEVDNKPSSLQPIAIKLTPDVITLENVTVKSNTQLVDVSSKEISKIRMSPIQLKQLPSLGEADVFRSLQLLPGVSGANEGESGLYVRGGTPDQNLILFDGMTIYHVDHFFGFFSAFNSDAIKDIQLIKGGFPAEYGGRISSVVDITGNSGNQSKVQFGAGVNLLSANAYLDGPIGKKCTFFIAFRRSYTDFIRSSLYKSIYKTMTGESAVSTNGTAQNQNVATGQPNDSIQSLEFQPKFYYYDLNSKLTFNLTSKDLFTLSFYNGKDNLDKSHNNSDVSMPDIGSDLTSQLKITDINKWGNTGISGKWARQWNSRLNSSILISHSKYFSTYNNDQTFSIILPTNDSTGSLSMASSEYENNIVRDYSGGINLTWNLNSSHTVKSGVQESLFESKYDYTMDDTVSLLARNDKGLLSAFYIQDKWMIGRNEITYGLRASQFDQTHKFYWEPRISVSIPIKFGFNLMGAWGYYNQFVNRVTNENVLEGSHDFWLLTNEHLKPIFAEHRILGVSYENNTWLCSIEGYQKIMKNLIEFSRRFTSQADYADYFFVGKGTAKGLEFLLQKKAGNFNGWIGYTLAKVDNTFPALNDGKEFPSDNDRRHQISIVAKYNLKRWCFAVTMIYASGKAYTAPESQYVLEMLNGEKISYIHVGNINSYRLPDYFRADLSVSRQFDFKKTQMDVGLSIFNFTNHKNVWYREYNLQTSPVTITDALMLGITPTIYVNLRTK